MQREREIVLNGRYKLLERSGSGGMATVYKAQDLMLRRLVAVKILHENLTGDEEFLRRFQREAHAAANLSHPNIVTVHDIGQDGHRHYIVMEFVNGRTLKELIRDHVEQTGHPLSIARTLELGIQICAGIGYAHRAGLVHCDVKPQNVLVTRDDRVKVADFGIARAMSQASLQTGSMLWGTPHYFSPEQAAGEPATPASDVYAIGIILFEMLSGRLPFQAESLPSLALKHMHEPPPLVTEFNPAVPRQMEQIINKVLSKEAAGRYRTAGQLERILRSYRDSSQQDTGPIVLPPMHVNTEPVQRLPVVTEQPTQIFDRSAPPSNVTPRSEMPTRAAMPMHGQQTPTRRPLEPHSASYHLLDETSEATTDWTILLLGIIAVVAMIGLIPLWFFVARAWGVW